MNPVTYKLRTNGQTQISVTGELGTGIAYLALGLAAREAFLKRSPVTVLENGVPFRTVSVVMPMGAPADPNG